MEPTLEAASANAGRRERILSSEEIRRCVAIAPSVIFLSSKLISPSTAIRCRLIKTCGLINP